MTDVIDWGSLPAMLKPVEVAKLLRVELQTVYRWGHSARLWPPGTVVRLPGGRKKRGPVRFNRDLLRQVVEEEARRGSKGEGVAQPHAVDEPARAGDLPSLREDRGNP